MKNLDDLKLTILPLGIVVLLAILWKTTQSVGSAMLLIVFWMSWRQLVKKFIIK